MKLRFWRKSGRRPARKAPVRTTARYGGMQERELQARLEILVDAALNRKRSVIDTARSLTAYSLVEQERFLATVDRLSLHSPELAYRFCHGAPPAVGLLSDEQWQRWSERVLQLFSTAGMDVACEFMEDLEAYHRRITPAPSAVSLDEVAGVLRNFLQGLGVQDLEPETGEADPADAAGLQLPPCIDRYPDRKTNFRLYKALAAHQWAQRRFGAHAVNLQDLADSFPDSARALGLFHHLETLRLDAGIARQLPGLAGEMAAFRISDRQYPPLWRRAAEELRQAGATAGDSERWLSRLYDEDWEPAAAEYQGELLPAVADLPDDGSAATARPAPAVDDAVAQNRPGGDAEPADGSAKAAHGGAYGYADPDAAGISPAYEPEREQEAAADSSAQTGSGESPAAGEYSYDEWDQARQCYRKAWCRLQEHAVEAGASAFATETVARYRGLVRRLRHTFALLRQEYRLLKRESYGDDIDIDALVESFADVRSGLEASERVFARTARAERNVAVIFMVDMSASTAGWINRVEREALLLLCEAMEALDDRYAIYGFSGRTRSGCRAYRIKTFDEEYGETVKARIGTMRAQDYTRMGAAVRHLSDKLSRVEARTRLLLVLSDGQPDDQDGYRGPYGIEDTRKALIEARRIGVHPFCVTIDRQARDYVPHMFGGANFAVIDQVEKLPARVGDIYRRLTT